MHAVGIKVLKNRLSEFVRLAAGGETILVLDRERVVAEIGPPAPSRTLAAHEAWKAEAVKQGWLRPALVRSTAPPQRFPSVSLERLLSELDEDRADR